MLEARLIDANALKQHYNVPDAESVFSYCDTIMQVIDSQPTIEAEPVRHGRWIERECYSAHGEEHAVYECSDCGCLIERKRFCTPPWCEWCGTKMDGGANNGNG